MVFLHPPLFSLVSAGPTSRPAGAGFGLDWFLTGLAFGVLRREWVLIPGIAVLTADIK